MLIAPSRHRRLGDGSRPRRAGRTPRTRPLRVVEPLLPLSGSSVERQVHSDTKRRQEPTQVATLHLAEGRRTRPHGHHSRRTRPPWAPNPNVELARRRRRKPTLGTGCAVRRPGTIAVVDPGMGQDASDVRTRHQDASGVRPDHRLHLQRVAYPASGIVEGKGGGERPCMIGQRAG
jgi:hypothetical protein